MLTDFFFLASKRAPVLGEGAVHQLPWALMLQMIGQLLAGQLLPLATVGTGDREAFTSLCV